MRTRLATLIALWLLTAAAPLRSAEEAQFNWTPWSRLAVQDGGRIKPLDTLSWETFRSLADRTRIEDPDSGQMLDRNQLYMALLFQWQGWEQPPAQAPSSGPQGHVQYFRNHRPDKWDRVPLLRIDYPQLQSELGMVKGEKYISPLDLSQARIAVPETHREQPFLVWAASLRRKEPGELTELETRALEAADHFWSYQDHRMGNRLRILPAPGNEEQEWTSVAGLLRAESGSNDATPPLSMMRRHFLGARAAYLSDSPAAFNEATALFLEAVRQRHSRLKTPPATSLIGLEVGYNHWMPFRCAWISMTLAFLCLLLSMRTNWKPLLVCGWVTFAVGLLAVVVGFAVRITIAARAPVTNMYESIVYASVGAAVLGAVFELGYRKRYVLTAAAAVAAFGLILADICSAELDPSLQPLQPVLRGNFWLVSHVMTITLSHAAFALASGIGNISLGYFLLGSTDRKTIHNLTYFSYRAMQIGVLLLATGILVGCVWADRSWGRFWGWDPKEVWALLTLLGYLGVLHARYAGRVHQFGAAVLSVACFLLVVMAWYGVNFMLGAGLHSYGFGKGGGGYVLTALALQGLFVIIAALRHVLRQHDERDRERLSTKPRVLPQTANA